MQCNDFLVQTTLHHFHHEDSLSTIRQTYFSFSSSFNEVSSLRSVTVRPRQQNQKPNQKTPRKHILKFLKNNIITQSTLSASTRFILYIFLSCFSTFNFRLKLKVKSPFLLRLSIPDSQPTANNRMTFSFKLNLHNFSSATPTPKFFFFFFAEERILKIFSLPLRSAFQSHVGVECPTNPRPKECAK